MRALAVVCVLTTAAASAPAPIDDVTPRTIVFARGSSLVKADGRGRGETELATLPANQAVRALRTDPRGTVLLADLDGAWSWMPLDGSTKKLANLPCEPGPAQISNDGTYLLCRAKTGSQVVNLKTGKLTPIDVPTAGARLVGAGTELRLVWADGEGIWNAVPPQRKAPRKVAPEAPVRHLLVSPDGTHAVAVYHDEVFERVRTKKPADVLSIIALDGTAARRKGIANGVPLEWSHDSKWVLVQDGRSACIMAAAGGQYKCWRGYTAAALSPDGKYALLFGNRRVEQTKPAPTKKCKGSTRKCKREAEKAAKAAKAARAKQAKKRAPADADEGETSDGSETEPEQPGEAPSDEASDDVALPPPGGPVALYRAELDGAFTKSPQLVTRDVAGAAVWIPTGDQQP